ncbi:MAG: MBL fold metallo-hydrolase [Thermovirgaceae bacterium]
MGGVEFLKIIVLMDDATPGTGDLVAQHGASFFLEIGSGDEIRNVLVDVGQSSEMLFYNMDRLCLSPEMVDAIVLTHCHYDHTGDLAEVIRAVGKGDLPVVAHPTLFRPHFAYRPCLRHVGVPHGNGPAEVEAAGGKLLLSADPVPLLDGVTTLGEVSRTTDFEEPGVKAVTSMDDKLVEDPLVDDTALAVQVEGQGVVVITGCSHSGIINILRRSLELFPGAPLDGVLGGFHLIKADDERIEKTVSAMADMKPRWIAAGHCTGFNAQVALRNRFKQTFEPLFVGKTVTVSKS